MTEPNEDKIDLIEKLLRKAESTTPEEAEALSAKAAALMQKYSINQALLNARNTSVKEKIEVVRIPLNGIYGMAYMDMMYSIAVAYGDVEAFYTKYSKTSIVLTVVGFESTVSQLKILLSSLQLQAVSALDAWWKSEERYTNATAMEKYKARRTFIRGFGQGVATRLRRSRTRVVRETEKTTPGSELVLRNRADAVSEFMKEKFGKLKTTRNREKSGGYDASSAGYRAGQNANTGDKQVSNKKALNA